MAATKVNCKIVNIRTDWVLVEFEHKGFLGRVFLPRATLNVTRKDNRDVDLSLLQRGMEYGIGGTLVAFLETSYPAVNARVLVDRLQRAGLWTREDYRESPETARQVISKLLYLDFQTLSAAIFR